MSENHCFNCKNELTLPDGPVGRGDSCPHCRSDVRVCFNCVHYDPKSYNDCRESQAERVVEKGKANFCDFFSFAGRFGDSQPDSEDVFKKLDDLFKK